MRVRAMLCVAALIGAAAGSAMAQSTAITYQGRLTDAGALAAGLYDLRFRLYESGNTTTQIGATVCVDNVTVTGGVFTATLDFGTQFIATFDRFLEIDVRRDTGLGCANTTGYTTLAPRQQMTPAPRATAATTANSLAIPNGSSVLVNLNNLGQVGIGTTSPNRTLTVAGNMELGTSSGDYRNLRIGGGNSDGFLFGSYPALGDGIHIGYNYYGDAAGATQIIHPDGGTSRVSVGYGTVALATAPPFAGAPVNRLVVEQSGAIRMGPTAQYYAAKSNRDDHMLRGTVNTVGTIGAGTGFTVSHTTGSGIYVVNFNTAFATAPTVVISSIAQARKVHVLQSQTGFFSVGATDTSNTSNNFADGGFTFIAIGE